MPCSRRSATKPRLAMNAATTQESSRTRSRVDPLPQSTAALPANSLPLRPAIATAPSKSLSPAGEFARYPSETIAAPTRIAETASTTRSPPPIRLLMQADMRVSCRGMMSLDGRDPRAVRRHGGAREQPVPARLCGRATKRILDEWSLCARPVRRFRRSRGVRRTGSSFASAATTGSTARLVAAAWVSCTRRPTSALVSASR